MTSTQISDRLEVIFDGASRPGDPPGESAPTAGGDRPVGGRDAHAHPDEPVGTAEAGGRPMFTITEAASACGVSRKTITRKLADLATLGAAKDDDGIWRIPVEALLAVGLHPGRSLPEPGPTTRVPAAAPVARSVTTTAVPSGPEMISVPRDRWDDLRIRLARAEAEASERALALADARLALRALTAGPTPTPPAPQAAPGPGALGIPIPADPGAGAGSPSVPTQGPAGPVQHSPVDPVPAPAPSAAPATTSPADPVAQARSQAAQTGGHVPAAGAPRKRRWWHAKA